MVKAAIADNYKLEVSDVEFQLPKPSYTIHTLAYLTEKHPDKSFRLIIGGDNLESFTKWKNYEQILAQHGIYVYDRPGTQPSELKSHPNVTIVQAPMLDISATYIRQCIREKKSIRYLVPEPVEQMIHAKGFYLK
jgi:nicotinate-nucleotide adenylyltransferase